MKIFIPYSITWYRSWFLFSMQNEFIKMKQKSQRYCFEIEGTEMFELTQFFNLVILFKSLEIEKLNKSLSFTPFQKYIYEYVLFLYNF